MRPLRWHRDGRDRRHPRAVVVRRTAHQRPPGSPLSCKHSRAWRPASRPCKSLVPTTVDTGPRRRRERRRRPTAATSPSPVRVSPDHPARRDGYGRFGSEIRA